MPDNANTRPVSYTVFETETLSTNINYHNKDKKQARDLTHRTGETSVAAEGTFNRMDVSYQLAPFPILPPP